MNVQEIVLVTAVVGIPIVFLVAKEVKLAIDENKLTLSSTPITEEEACKLRRMYELFDDVWAPERRCWIILDTSELVEICVTAIDIQYNMNGKNKGYSRRRLLCEVAKKCRDLSCWVEKHSDGYDPKVSKKMASLLVKPKEVAEILENKAYEPHDLNTKL
jgi:hypothetical protein